MHTLESLIGHSSLREVDATTKRLVERCLAGDWCVPLRRMNSPGSDSSTPGFSGGAVRNDIIGIEGLTSADKNDYIPSSSPENLRSLKHRDNTHSLKTSKSAENLRVAHGTKGKMHSHNGGSFMKQGNVSAFDLQSMGAALASTSLPSSPHAHSPAASTSAGVKPYRASTLPDQNLSTSSITSLPSSASSLDQLAGATSPPKQPSMARAHSHSGSSASSGTASPVHANSLGQAVDSIVVPTSLPAGRSVSSMSGKKNSHNSQNSQQHHQQRRSAPPTPPPKRRKPPAIPTARTPGGGTMMTIASSRTTPSPLSSVHP